MTELEPEGKAKLAELKAGIGRGLSGPAADMLMEYALLWQRKFKADSAVAEHGLLVGNQAGYPTESPWLSVSLKCGAEMRRVAKEIEAAQRRRSGR